jgi:hypothetical protein
MQGQVVLIHLEAPAGAGLRLRSDGSTGPAERLSNIDHRLKENPAGRRYPRART